MNQTHEGFGTRLRLARKKRGESQVTLAKRAGVGRMTLRRAEEGTFEPRMETARKLADALEVRLEWLLTGDGDMYEPWRRVADAGEAAWYKEIERGEGRAEESATKENE